MFLFCAGVSFMTLSSNAIVPPSIELNPAIILSNVVFPQPEGPSNVKNSPFLMVVDKSGIIVISPYFFTTSFTFILTLMFFSRYIIILSD